MFYKYISEEIVVQNGLKFWVAYAVLLFFRRAGLMQQCWRSGEGTRSPSTSAASQYRFPSQTSSVGWVCWFSTLLREVFPVVLRFCPLTRKHHSICFDLLWFDLCWIDLIWFPGRFSFDQIVRFEIPVIPCEECNSIFRNRDETRPSRFEFRANNNNHFIFVSSVLSWAQRLH